MAKFWIAIGSIVLALIVATVTTIMLIQKKTIKVDFEFAEIKAICVYDHSLIPNSIEEGSVRFSEIQNELNKSMNIRKLNTIGKSISVNTTVRLLADEKYYNRVMYDGKCVELEFASEQTQIAHYNENTKKITYTKLLIVLDGTNEISDHVVYYANSDGDYQDQPMVIAFNEGILQTLFK